MSDLHLSPPCEEGPSSSSSSAGADALSMRRRGLRSISSSLLNITHLKSLHLEGNEIRSLPQHLFSRLPSLLWLDVRNNRITALPVAVGQHRCLKTLLLEGNPITELPAELGDLKTLKALSLRNCPLTFPPQDVLDRGLPMILQYLRSSISFQLEVKLHLCEDDEEDEGGEDDPEIRRFQELRLRMIQMDESEENPS